MDRTAFDAELSKWLSDTRHEALRLHADGVPSENCLTIAMHIANAKATKRALEQQRHAELFGVSRRPV